MNQRQQEIINKLQAGSSVPPKVLIDCEADREQYDEVRNIFNQRFDYKPAFIILVKSTAQVANAVKVAAEYELPLRVCSGRHDHEGECSGNGTLLIDFREMVDWKVDGENAVSYTHLTLPTILLV